LGPPLEILGVDGEGLAIIGTARENEAERLGDELKELKLGVIRRDGVLVAGIGARENLRDVTVANYVGILVRDILYRLREVVI